MPTPTSSAGNRQSSARRPASRGGRAPFGGLQQAMAIPVVYLVLALVWLSGVVELPGGRWFAVHLFTLGVLTTLVVALTHHFAQTLMHRPSSDGGARLVVLNAGTLLVLVGLPTAQRWMVALGATASMVAVGWLYVDLRRMRRASLTNRFGYVVRAYERACSAFLHGALLGALMGTGLLGGAWYAAGRVAHLHVMLLGWGGLTLLATVVFFGPTVMRARMEDGADAAAAPALRRASYALSLATLALLLTGAGGMLAVGARVVAAAGLAVYAFGAAAICLPVIRTGQRAKSVCTGRTVQASACWFVLVVAADVVVVATGQDRLLDALGVVMLTGVLGQAILAALGHLLPMAFVTTAAGRTAAHALLGRLPAIRPAIFNVGVLLVAVAVLVGPAAGSVGAGVLRTGGLLVGGAVVVHLGLLGVAVAGTRGGSKGPPAPGRPARAAGSPPVHSVGTGSSDGKL